MPISLRARGREDRHTLAPFSAPSPGLGWGAPGTPGEDPRDQEVSAFPSLGLSQPPASAHPPHLVLERGQPQDPTPAVPLCQPAGGVGGSPCCSQPEADTPGPALPSAAPPPLSSSSPKMGKSFPAPGGEDWICESTPQSGRPAPGPQLREGPGRRWPQGAWGPAWAIRHPGAGGWPPARQDSSLSAAAPSSQGVGGGCPHLLGNAVTAKGQRPCSPACKSSDSRHPSSPAHFGCHTVKGPCPSGLAEGHRRGALLLACCGMAPQRCGVGLRGQESRKQPALCLSLHQVP